MRSTYMGIELAKRSLFAHQTSLMTTGHNVANANTTGYSRQVVNLVAARPLENLGLMRSAIPGQQGQSVLVDSIMRVRNTFLDKQFYNENKSLGQWETRLDTLQKLEGIINEPSDTGLRQVMDNFWNSWQELSLAPDNLEARAVVKESALALADAFNHMAKQLNDLRADLTDHIDVKVTEVNTLLSQIAVLNAEIYRIEGFGNNANDLRDQRDNLVDQLSRIINITVVHEERGYTVLMGNVELVNGAEAAEFDLALAEASYAEDGTGNLNSGELFGLFYSRDKLVRDYENQMDALVTTLVEQVNLVHRQGYTLKHPVEMGGDFFVFADVDPSDPNPPSFAARIRLSSSIENDVENIAASARTYDDNGVTRVVKGNNENALAIAELRNIKFNFAGSGIEKIVLNGGTFDEYFRAVVGAMGVQAQEAERQTVNQRILVEQVDMRRASVSGVSLDEEMANMIKFQHAYNAAARAMTTYDEILDKVINGMGIVGR